jgi:hypothetical protein
MRGEREAQLARYLLGVIEKGYASADTIEAARSSWEALDAATDRRVAIPNAGPGPNGEMILTWDQREHHFEIEVAPAEPPYLFYRNRESGETWGADLEPGEPVALEAIQHLLRFTQ